MFGSKNRHVSECLLLKIESKTGAVWLLDSKQVKMGVAFVHGRILSNKTLHYTDTYYTNGNHTNLKSMVHISMRIIIT